MTPEILMDKIGHDGTPEMLGRPRQFTIQELIDAVYIYGYSLTEILVAPLFADAIAGDLPDDGSLTLASVFTPEREKYRLEAYMANHIGMLVGREASDKNHAVIWLGSGKVLDPFDGQTKDLTESISIEAFYFLTKIMW